ncbi:MAG TPA: M23 family metallopeptidase [Mycobacteriales bacterium]|jgi:hypothetical protein
MRPTFRRLLAVSTATVALLGSPHAFAADTYTTDRVTVPMVFPVLGPTSYSDTFLACRSGCTRKHMGQDLMGPKMRPLVAAFNGVIHSIKAETTVGDGNYFTLKGDNGWSANYIHVNNDTPGTDDGRGTARYAFAPGLRVGLRVVAGQLLGWSGDSGNAESTGPHLHFELRKGDPWSGTVYNAYWSLNAARRLGAPVVSGPHPDGTLIRACGTCPVYELRDGRKRPVLREVMAERGWDVRGVLTVSSYEFNAYSYSVSVPLPNGRAYRGPDGAVWFVQRRTRVAIPDVALLAPLGIPAARVRTTTAAALATVGVAPAGTALPATPYYEGALLKDATASTLWLVENGARRWVPDTYTLASRGLNALDAIAVTAEQQALPGFPALGAPLVLGDGAVYKDSSNRPYAVSNGTRRPFPSWAVYDNYGYRPVLLTAVPSTTLARLPVGAPMP